MAEQQPPKPSPFKRQVNPPKPTDTTPVPQAQPAPTPAPTPPVDAVVRRARHDERVASTRPEGVEVPVSTELKIVRPEAGKTYEIAKGPGRDTWKWWSRMYNVDPVLVDIEGPFQQVIGVPITDQTITSHYLVTQLVERRQGIPVRHPVHKDQDFYVARIQGKRVLVHGSELAE